MQCTLLSWSRYLDLHVWMYMQSHVHSHTTCTCWPFKEIPSYAISYMLVLITWCTLYTTHNMRLSSSIGGSRGGRLPMSLHSPKGSQFFCFDMQHFPKATVLGVGLLTPCAVNASPTGNSWSITEFYLYLSHLQTTKVCIMTFYLAFEILATVR